MACAGIHGCVLQWKSCSNLCRELAFARSGAPHHGEGSQEDSFARCRWPFDGEVPFDEKLDRQVDALLGEQKPGGIKPVLLAVVEIPFTNPKQIAGDMEGERPGVAGSAT